MSQDPIAETRSKLDNLEQRIHAAKNSLGATGSINDEAQKDWAAMIEKHADIRRKLDARPDHPNGFIEGIRFDVDPGLLERWNLWQKRRPLGSRDCQDLDLAGRRMRGHRDCRQAAHLYVPADDRGHRLAPGLRRLPGPARPKRIPPVPPGLRQGFTIS